MVYIVRVLAICDWLCEKPPCLRASFDLILELNMIMCNIVKISISVYKFPSFLLVQRNQKLIDLLGLYSCFEKQCKIREHAWRVFTELVTYYVICIL